MNAVPLDRGSQVKRLKSVNQIAETDAKILGRIG
jgi:hypothetical protein